MKRKKKRRLQSKPFQSELVRVLGDENNEMEICEERLIRDVEQDPKRALFEFSGETIVENFETLVAFGLKIDVYNDVLRKIESRDFIIKNIPRLLEIGVRSLTLINKGFLPEQTEEEFINFLEQGVPAEKVISFFPELFESNLSQPDKLRQLFAILEKYDCGAYQVQWWVNGHAEDFSVLADDIHRWHAEDWLELVDPSIYAEHFSCDDDVS